MENQTELNRVTELFEHWRKSRTHANEQIPEELRREAVGLLDHHQQAQILKSLRLNSTQLSSWRKTFETEGKAPSAFVTLPVETTPVSSSALNLELSFPGGCQLRLTGEMTPELLRTLTQSLLQSPGMQP